MLMLQYENLCDEAHDLQCQEMKLILNTLKADCAFQQCSSVNKNISLTYHTHPAHPSYLQASNTLSTVSLEERIKDLLFV